MAATQYWMLYNFCGLFTLQRHSHTQPLIHPHLCSDTRHFHVTSWCTYDITALLAWQGAHTSAPRSMTPASAMGTYLSPICTSSRVLSTWDLRPGSLWQGNHRCTTGPSMPRSGTHPAHCVLPPFSRHSSHGHCTSIRRFWLMLSNTKLVSMIW